MDKVWGYTVGKCAWCLIKPAVKAYVGQQAGGEQVEYQVCNKCHLNMA